MEAILREVAVLVGGSWVEDSEIYRAQSLGRF